MPLNPDFLVCAPMLQNLLVDKTGEPLIGGVVSCYQDNSRTTFKNWYYQTGTLGNYSYLPLTNPLTLSAAGTICDPSGNDTLPFYYVVSETDNITPQPYYITVYDEYGNLQFTRQNFPFTLETGVIPIENDINIDNYIINNRFWRNIGSINATTLNYSWTKQYNNSGTVYHQALAPSQHDAFSMPDIQYIKNVNGASDTITFNKFTAQDSVQFENDIAGEYYLNHSCTGTQTGEIIKCYQFPISLHNLTLANAEFTFTIQAQCISGTNTITVGIYQFAGTGNASSLTTLETITLNANWQQYTISSVFPNTVNLPAVTTNDDALYLQIGMPMAADGICNINFALPSIYLSVDEIPTNNFQTYDQIDAVITTPRTGDVRISINDYYNFGWLPMNDGTIGSAATSAYATSRANADSWPLFNTIWNLFGQYSQGNTSSGSNIIAPMFALIDDSLTQVGYGPSISTNAISDWQAGNVLSLTAMMGRVIMGTTPISAMIGGTFRQGVTASNSGGNLLFTGTNGNYFFVGQPVTFNTYSSGSFPGNIVANAVYYVTNVNSGAATFNVAATYANAIARTPVIAYTSTGSNVEVNTDQSGVYIGEFAHQQSMAELAAHNHSVVGTASVNISLGGTAVALPSGTTTTGTTGNSIAFNVVQPATFMNMYIRL